MGSYKVTEKTGLIAGCTVVDNDEDIMMITSDGIVIRTDVEEISMFSRVTQGVRVMKLADGIKVVSIAKAKKEEEDEKDQEEASDDNSQFIQ